MPQKNTSIFFTLFASVFMMMFVASLFHLPNSQVNKGIASSFFAGIKTNEGRPMLNIIDNNNIYLRAKNSLPQE